MRVQYRVCFFACAIESTGFLTNYRTQAAHTSKAWGCWLLRGMMTRWGCCWARVEGVRNRLFSDFLRKDTRQVMSLWSFGIRAHDLSAIYPKGP